jgi:hypothetical protein
MAEIHPTLRRCAGGMLRAARNVHAVAQLHVLRARARLSRMARPAHGNGLAGSVRALCRPVADCCTGGHRRALDPQDAVLTCGRSMRCATPFPTR